MACYFLYRDVFFNCSKLSSCNYFLWSIKAFLCSNNKLKLFKRKTHGATLLRCLKLAIVSDKVKS